MGHSSRVPTVLLFWVLLDMMASGLVISLLPTLRKELGLGADVYGLIGAVYGGMQLVGSPLLGRASDIYGRKAVIMLSMGVSSIGYYGLSQVYTVSYLLLSRIPIGIFKHSVSLSYAYASAVVKPECRSKEIAKIGVANGIGLSLGPFIGGTLDKWFNDDDRVGAYLASGIFAVNFMLVFFFLPSDSRGGSGGQAMASKEGRTSFLGSFADILRRGDVLRLLVCRLLSESAFQVVQSMFFVYTQERFEVSSATNSYILSFYGGCMVMVQLFAIKWILAHYSVRTIVTSSLIVLIGGYLVLGVAGHIAQVVGGLVLIAIGNNLLKVSLLNQVSLKVQSSESGGMMGTFSAVDSFTRITVPILAGKSIDAYGPTSPWFVCAGLCAGVFVAMPRFTDAKKKKQ